MLAFMWKQLHVLLTMPKDMLTDTLPTCRLQRASRDPVCLWWIDSSKKLGLMPW